MSWRNRPPATNTLSTVTVTGDSPLKADQAASSKFTAPLVDTPKTVQVITEEVLQQTGATSLQEALKATPGITFGNGEGGNPTGDQAFIRGMDAQASTFVDGMRDIAAGSREVFNLEAIEVIKGADSAYAGRGGAGGSINLATKKAKNENFIAADVGLGTDQYKRTTLDLNRKLSDTVGLRLNAMAHDADVAGRNGPENKRWGIAPTVTFGMGTPTEITLGWQHLQTDDVPDGGIPYRWSNTQAANLPGGSTVRPEYGASRKNWYGLDNRDFQKKKAICSPPRSSTNSAPPTSCATACATANPRKTMSGRSLTTARATWTKALSGGAVTSVTHKPPRCKT